MSRATLRGAVAVAIALPSAAPRSAHAQSIATPQRSVEVGGLHHWVSGHYGDWDGAYARLVVPAGSGVWYAEGLAQHAFGDRGAYLGVAHRRDVSQSLFVSAGVGTGTGEFFFPLVRTDATVGARWGADRRAVTSLGATYVRSRARFRDAAVTATTALYFGRAAIEMGARGNWSFPGRIGSRRAFGALTVVPTPRHMLAVRVGAGTEGYQLLGPRNVAVAFSSRDLAASWRARLGARWGTTVAVEAYDNRLYSRIGLVTGMTRYW